MRRSCSALPTAFVARASVLIRDADFCHRTCVEDRHRLEYDVSACEQDRRKCEDDERRRDEGRRTRGHGRSQCGARPTQAGKMPAGTTSMVISTGSGLVRSVKRGGDIDDYLRRTRDEDERHLGNDVREDVQTFP